MNNKAYIGVDIGGTSISAGCIINGELVRKGKIDTNPQREASEILDSLYELINSVIQDNTVGIGLGVPGYLDVKTGKIIYVNNIPSFSELEIANILSKEFNLPVKINNDANCFVLGESIFGLRGKFSNIVGLTCGTGLGGSVMVNGKVISSVYGGAGEFGLIPYRNTVFEDYCSGKFFTSHYKKTGEELYKSVESGDEKALEAFKVLGFHLANLIRNIMYFIAPQAIIIGGSVANSFHLFKPAIDNYLTQLPEKHLAENTQILKATLPSAALYGAASLVM